MTAATGFDANAVEHHLIERSLVAPKTPLSITPLGGGVSSDIFSVSGPGVELVVKRALPRLRVEQEWRASDSRVITESRALELAGALAPGAVPAIVDLDWNRRVLTIERAPADWLDWRTLLLAGRSNADVAKSLGRLLAKWHIETAASSEALAGFTDISIFVDLRIDPFYRTTADRHPRLASRINSTADALLATKTCLVHGDFSPKNVLTGSGRVWVIDWEVSHLGDPNFDIAYLLTHLLLKSIHRRQDSFLYRALARVFLSEYGKTVDCDVGGRSSLLANLGCLLLARVDGKSPAAYLTPPEQIRVRALATTILLDPPAHVLRLWERL